MMWTGEKNSLTAQVITKAKKDINSPRVLENYKIDQRITITKKQNRKLQLKLLNQKEIRENDGSELDN